jgi:hypothetical protein
MEILKNNKLKLKFSLSDSVEQELHHFKNVTNHKSGKKDDVNEGVPKKAKKSRENLPSSIGIMIDYLHTLQKKYPVAFPLNSRPVLKKGVAKDIADELQISKNLAKKFLWWYTLSKKYLTAHKVDAPRYSLSGSVVGYVTENEAVAKLDLVNTSKIKELKKEIA